MKKTKSEKSCATVPMNTVLRLSTIMCWVHLDSEVKSNALFLLQGSFVMEKL
jgi:hypothetical protein